MSRIEEIETDNDVDLEPKIVVSMTTHAARASMIYPALSSWVESCDRVGATLLLTIGPGVYEKLPISVRELEDAEKVVIDIVERDHGSSMKYTHAMMKYPDRRVLAVDDDVTFPSGFLGMMDAFSCIYRDAILCGRARIVQFSEDRLPVFTRSTPIIRGSEISEVLEAPPNALPEHVNGVMYPPGALVIGPGEIEEMVSKAFHDDDVYARVLAMRGHVRTAIVPISPPTLLDRIIPGMREHSLWREGNRGMRTENTLRNFSEWTLGSPTMNPALVSTGMIYREEV